MASLGVTEIIDTLEKQEKMNSLTAPRRADCFKGEKLHSAEIDKLEKDITSPYMKTIHGVTK